MKTMTIIAQPRLTEIASNTQRSFDAFLESSKGILKPVSDSRGRPLYLWQLSLADGLAALPRLSKAASSSDIRLAVLVTDEAPELAIVEPVA